MKNIEYADKSWNPFTGCRAIDQGTCAVGRCCWAFRMAHRLKGRFGYDREHPFRPTFHENVLKRPLKRKKPTRWDSCFMGDIGFCRKSDLKKILNTVKKCPQHTFFFLTKRPELVQKKGLEFPDNAWVGVTVNDPDDLWRIDELKKIKAKIRWISFEPVYSCIVIEENTFSGIQWIVIGAQTNPELQPKRYWLSSIIYRAEVRGIPIFTKENLKTMKARREFP